MGQTVGRAAAKPFARWSEDTERAFLLALRLTGQATRAAAEIGRSTAGAYGRRKRDPNFARAWDEAVTAQQADWIAAHQARLDDARGEASDAAGGGRLTPGRVRCDGWDAPRRRAFLRALARSKDVRSACRVAGMSSSSAYKLRGRSAAFAKAWDKALRAEVPSLAEAAYARAVEGWDEPIVQGGQVVATRRRYSDGLLRDLLRREWAQVEARTARTTASAEQSAGRGWQPRPRSLDEVRDSIIRKLQAIERQRWNEEAERDAGDWLRWREMWGGGGLLREED